MITTLLYGFVLISLPAFLARVATIVCLGTGAGLLLLVFRLSDYRDSGLEPRPVAGGTMRLGPDRHRGARGTASRWRPVDPAPGRRPRPRPPPRLRDRPRSSRRRVRSGEARGSSRRQAALWSAACDRRLGPRDGVHVEVFAANRVVLVPAGIGTRPPRGFSAGRISSARCYGELVTLDPTGLVLVRAGSRPVLADLFRAWGEPLSTRRLASFAASTGARVAVFVDGRRWHGSPGRVPLAPHAEIVLEVGPYVPPHRSYTFPPGT